MPEKKKAMIISASLVAGVIVVVVIFFFIPQIPPSPMPHPIPRSWNDPMIWQRPIRLRTLSATGWDAPGYTANQILAMLTDLKPTMLHRYVTGHQDPSAQVPVCGGCAPMTVTEFLQASESASVAVIVARISINEYATGTLFTTSQNVLSIPINPPIRMLSIDDYNGWIKTHSQATWIAISNQLFAQGWVWLETGGPGSAGLVPDGTTNYASVEFSQGNNFVVSSSAVKAWTSKPGIQRILASMTFPTDISYLQSLATSCSSCLAAIFSDVAGNQTVVGYHMIYFILQGNWDTNQIVITSGPYSGMTLYQEMKTLMNTYNKT